MVRDSSHNEKNPKLYQLSQLRSSFPVLYLNVLIANVPFFEWLYFTLSSNNFRYHSRLTRRLSVTIVSFFPIKQLFFETIDTQWYNNLRRNSIWNTVTFSILTANKTSWMIRSVQVTSNGPKRRRSDSPRLNGNLNTVVFGKVILRNFNLLSCFLKNFPSDWKHEKSKFHTGRSI